MTPGRWGRGGEGSSEGGRERETGCCPRCCQCVRETVIMGREGQRRDEERANNKAPRRRGGKGAIAVVKVTGTRIRGGQEGKVGWQ